MLFAKKYVLSNTYKPAEHCAVIAVASSQISRKDINPQCDSQDLWDEYSMRIPALQHTSSRWHNFTITDSTRLWTWYDFYGTMVTSTRLISICSLPQRIYSLSHLTKTNTTQSLIVLISKLFVETQCSLLLTHIVTS